MRFFILIFFLLFGSPAVAQQLKEITNSIGMKLVLIHAGSFTMGSPVSEAGRQDNEKPQEVTISKSFYLGVYEVNQDEFEKVTGENLSSFKGIKHPVETVSWDDAVSFCKKLSESSEEKQAGREYRLPTEAEWEYACRATSTTSYCFGDSAESLEEYGWIGENSETITRLVGKKKPNRWGLYDMHGNVSEWCQDWHAAYRLRDAIDPSGPKRGEGERRISRGGSWNADPASCRSACRNSYDPSCRFLNIGFRVAMSLPAKQPESKSTK